LPAQTRQQPKPDRKSDPQCNQARPTKPDHATKATNQPSQRQRRTEPNRTEPDKQANQLIYNQLSQPNPKSQKSLFSAKNQIFV
jgi:hypothetical protein